MHSNLFFLTKKEFMKSPVDLYAKKSTFNNSKLLCRCKNCFIFLNCKILIRKNLTPFWNSKLIFQIQVMNSFQFYFGDPLKNVMQASIIATLSTRSFPEKLSSEFSLIFFKSCINSDNWVVGFADNFNQNQDNPQKKGLTTFY